MTNLILASQNRMNLAFAAAEEAMGWANRLPETERPARRAKVGNLAGELALKSGNVNRAKSIFGEVLMHHENVSRDAVEQITCHYRLGQCDRQLKQFDSAETHLKTAYDRLQVQGVIDEASRKIRTEAIVQELILLYTDWDKPTLATEWKAKSVK